MSVGGMLRMTGAAYSYGSGSAAGPCWMSGSVLKELTVELALESQSHVNLWHQHRRLVYDALTRLQPVEPAKMQVSVSTIDLRWQ